MLIFQPTLAESHKAVDLLIDALIQDGAHHKQWYIEQALKTLGYDLDVLKAELIAEDYEWEPGIPP